MITTSYPRAADGSEAAGSFVADLVDELAKHLPVRVVAPGTTVAHEVCSANIEVFRFAAPAQALSLLKPWRPRDVYWAIRVLRGGWAAVRKAVGSDATHILALWGLPCGEWARLVARKHGIGYSVWMLGSDVWSFGRMPVLRKMLARVISQARHAYADGHKLAADAHRIGRAPVAFLPSTRKINVVNPPPPRAEPPYRLLFLGRWHPNKGVDLLLDALDMLQDADWALIRCVEIQGGGPLHSLVHARVANLRARGRSVEVGAFLAKTDAEAAIARADWLLIPSRIESIPVVFSDAMKLGRPVIAMPTGDLPRLIGEIPACGLLADSLSSEGFCRALKAALRTSPRAYAEGVRREAACFDLTSIAERICREILHND
ncbi:MAG: glycosyltransferase [Rudaea sp.]|nr:glycosyltransferase [Rudaea sp.]